jgi:SAM-dependent methyltransferase
MVSGHIANIVQAPHGGCLVRLSLIRELQMPVTVCPATSAALAPLSCITASIHGRSDADTRRGQEVVPVMDYDTELQLHHGPLLRACEIRSDEHVLDIGCGAGQTTRDAARRAAGGSAFGVDTSASMIARAREFAAAEGLRNARFEQGDAQVHNFPSEHFDAAISRYGTMFFADPVAAFSNIRGALRPRGRLVMMVWQSHGSNEWSLAVERALAAQGAATVSPGSPDPFSLADPRRVERILGAAGFTDTSFSDVRESVCYGASVDAAFDWVRGFLSTRDLLGRLDPTASARAVETLRETLAEHYRVDGVWFDSRAWIVTAERH